MAESLSASNLFRYPEWVDERAARAVAAGVVGLTGVYLLTGWAWLLVVITAGFVARVTTGPAFDPLARVVSTVVVPRLASEPNRVPGSPKRFAQGIGAALSIAATIAHFAGMGTLALILVAMITAAAFLESAFAFCLGCVIFARLMAAGIIPESACAACNDLSGRLAPAAQPKVNMG